MPVGDSYAPQPGPRVILWMKAEEGHEPDRLVGTVISHVSWRDHVDGDDRLRVMLKTSWGPTVPVPLDRVQQVTNLDAKRPRRAAHTASGDPPFATWLSEAAIRDRAFEMEKDDMLGRIDVEQVRPPGRDSRRSED